MAAKAQAVKDELDDLFSDKEVTWKPTAKPPAAPGTYSVRQITSPVSSLASPFRCSSLASTQ